MTLLGGGLDLTTEDFAGIEALAAVHGDDECLVLDPNWNFTEAGERPRPVVP